MDQILRASACQEFRIPGAASIAAFASVDVMTLLLPPLLLRVYVQPFEVCLLTLDALCNPASFICFRFRLWQCRLCHFTNLISVSVSARSVMYYLCTGTSRAITGSHCHSEICTTPTTISLGCRRVTFRLRTFNFTSEGSWSSVSQCQLLAVLCASFDELCLLSRLLIRREGLVYGWHLSSLACNG